MAAAESDDRDMGIPADAKDAREPEQSGDSHKGLTFIPPPMGTTGGEWVDLEAEGRHALAITSHALALAPILGEAKGIYEGWNGKDSLTGEQLSTFERVLDFVPVLGTAVETTAHFMVGLNLTEHAALAGKAIEGAEKLEVIKEALKHEKEIGDALLTAGHLKDDVKLLDEGVRHAIDAMKLGQEVDTALFLSQMAKILDYTHIGVHVVDLGISVFEKSSSGENEAASKHEAGETKGDGKHGGDVGHEANHVVEKHYVLDPIILRPSGDPDVHHGTHHAHGAHGGGGHKEPHDTGMSLPEHRDQVDVMNLPLQTHAHGGGGQQAPHDAGMSLPEHRDQPDVMNLPLQTHAHGGGGHQAPHDTGMSLPEHRDQPDVMNLPLQTHAHGGGGHQAPHDTGMSLPEHRDQVDVMNLPLQTHAHSGGGPTLAEIFAQQHSGQHHDWNSFVAAHPQDSSSTPTHVSHDVGLDGHGGGQ